MAEQRHGKTWGGARPGSGPHRRRLQLDEETAHRLNTLTKQARAINPAATEETVVAALIALLGSAPAAEGIAEALRQMWLHNLEREHIQR